MPSNIDEDHPATTSSRTLIRDSLVRTNNPFSTERRQSNPFARNPFAPPPPNSSQISVATPISNDVEDLSCNPLSPQLFASLRIKLSSSDSPITKLRLREATINSEQTCQVSRIIEATDRMEELDISFNPIGSIGAAALSEMLKFNRSLTLVDLRSDKINATGGTMLGKALAVNKGLRRLRLGNNTLGDAGVTALAIGLYTNSTLCILELENNEIGEVGATAVGAALDEKNSKCQLQELHLEINPLDEKGVEPMLHHLMNNNSLASAFFTDKNIEVQVLRSNYGNVNMSGSFLAPVDAIASILLMGRGTASSDTPQTVESLHLNDVCLSGLDTAGRGKRNSRPCYLLGERCTSSSFAHIKALHLSGNDLSFSEVSALMDGLTKNTSLQVLDLSRNRLDNKTSELLVSVFTGALASVERLELGDNPGLLSGPMAGGSWGCMLTDHRGPKKLRRLSIANTGLKSAGAQEMFGHLLRTVTDSVTVGWPLRWLDMRGNLLNSSAKVSLSTALSTVTAAMLRGGNLHLKEALWGLSSPWAARSPRGQPEDVAFNFCGFTCDSFDLSPTLVVLNCQNARLGVEDSSLIAALICHHQHLKSLILDGNSAIGDAGTKALVNGVLQSPSVESLSLRGCGVARSGGSALQELVSQKPGTRVRATAGNPNMSHSARRFLEEHERNMDFENNMGRERLVILKPTLAPDCPQAPRVCRCHILGETGVGKRSLAASLGRGWASSFMTEETGTDSAALPVLSVADSMILANNHTTSTWIHGDGGNLMWLRTWSDAMFLVVVDLSIDDRAAQHASIVKCLKRIQTSAPFNASIILVGSNSDKLGKLGEDYLSSLSDSVSEALMQHAGNFGPPPPFSSCVAVDCRKSQSPGMKQLRSLLISEQSRVVERVPIPSAPLTPYVYAILQKYSRETWIPGSVDTVTTPIVHFSELLHRCRIDVYPGLQSRELYSILKSLHRSGAYLLVEGVVESDDHSDSFVILNEDWFMRQILAPASMMSLDALDISHAHSTVSSLAFGSTRPNVLPLTKCLLRVLLSLNYTTIIGNKVMMILGAKLPPQPPFTENEEVDEEDIASLSSRLEIESPLGGIEEFTWRLLMARIISVFTPPRETLIETGESMSQPTEIVELFSDAVVIKGLANRGKCMVQLVNSGAIDIVVTLDPDKGSVLELFEIVKNVVNGFLASERTFHVTLLDELTGLPNTWKCPPQERTAVCSNVPPSPVYICRKKPSLGAEEMEPETVVIPETVEETVEESSMNADASEVGEVIYRENWSLLTDLDNTNSAWSEGKRRTLSTRRLVGKSSGRYELMIPHPKSLQFGESQMTSELTMTTVLGVSDLNRELSESAFSRLIDAVGDATVITCLSSFKNHLRSLKNMHITYVSEVPWDKEAIDTTMSADLVTAALEQLHFPVYLTLATDNNDQEADRDEMIDGCERDLRLLVLATTRQAVEREEEWRLIGDVPPTSVSWRLVVIDTKCEVPVFGVDNVVDVTDFCVTASYPLTNPKRFILDHTESVQSSSGAEEESVEALVYVHGFLTPLCNALKSTAIMARCCRNRLAICFSWPCDPEFINHSWIMTKVMSEFERNYTHAEQHMHGSINYLVSFARELPGWGLTPIWRAHSMGNYLTLNAVERLCWVSEKGDQNALKSIFNKVILDAPDVPTWFFKDTLEKIVNEPYNCSVLHLFNPLDTAVEAGRMRRAIQGAYPGNALVVNSVRQRGGGEVQVVSCEGAASDVSNHDYGQTDGWCLRDQKEYLAGVPPHQRLLNAVFDESMQAERSHPIYWKLKLG